MKTQEKISNKENISNAVSTLCEALREDKDFYYGYQANIAMAFKDEYRSQFGIHNHEIIHRIANQAAKNFLDLFIKQPS